MNGVLHRADGGLRIISAVPIISCSYLEKDTLCCHEHLLFVNSYLDRCAWLVTACRRSEGDGGPVPGVDRDHRQRQIDNLLVVEMLMRPPVQRVVDCAVGNARDRFGPSERRALPLAVERRLTPRRKHITPFFAFAGDAG